MASSARVNQTQKDDFVAVLVELGWSQADVARHLSVHQNTVSGWATGRTPIPGPVRAYLSISVGIKRLVP